MAVSVYTRGGDRNALLKSEIRSLTSDVLSCLNLSVEATKRKGKRGEKVLATSSTFLCNLVMWPASVTHSGVSESEGLRLPGFFGRRGA